MSNNYTEEEISIIGILSENELIGKTNLGELERIFYDALSIGPMYGPLVQDLERKGMILEAQQVKRQDVKEALYSVSFMDSSPMVSSF